MTVLRRLLAGLLVIAAACSAPGQLRAEPAQNPEQAQPSGDVDALIRILEDDRARAALIERLRAAQGQAAPSGAPDQNQPVKKPGEVDGPSSAPDDASAVQSARAAEGDAEPTLARRAAEYTRAVAERGAALVAASSTLIADLGSIFAGPLQQNVDWPRLLALALTIGVTFGAFLALRALGIPFYRSIGRRSISARLPERVALIGVSALVDAVMVLVAWAGGYVFALQFGAYGVITIQQSLFLNAFLAIELLKVVLRATTSPRYPGLRAAPIGDEAAAYWYFWASRLISTLGYTFLFVAPILTAAVSPGAAQAVRVVVAFASLMMAVAIVLQNRERVHQRLAARTQAAHTELVSAFYGFLARFWHWIAIAWLVALFTAWLVNPGEALPFIAKATLQTLAAVAIGAIATALISRLIAGGMRVPADVRARLPLLESRLNAFVPAVLKAVRLIVLLIVLLAVAQSWALVDLLGWLSTAAGARFAASTLTAGLIIIIGLAAYVAVSSWIEYRLNPAFGHVPTARESTLLTLFRNAFTIALFVLVGMLALAEIGVNIAPLLAGAGVLGLAIGFGAQKLVQDIITGAFIQFENAMNAGDNVKVGGVQGTVEHLTIRSVGIRSVDGVYHLIPFSSVDSVSNATKTFSYHMAEIGVAYRESIPEVKQAMQDAFDLLKEGPHGADITGPFELHGLTKFGDSAITVRGRIKTVPGRQFMVGRAYNEIVKEIFDERGIEMPFPHLTLYMGEDKRGDAPPLRVTAAVDLASRREPHSAASGRQGKAALASETFQGHDGAPDEGGGATNG
ncbi:mechanosensitive ion channel domain-containing protein [Hansschlegelia sp.]|uniref:mechanosensitive ion channel domain-containing protein n=1 Tax=Hansschlegelia sp. TaxID=2041892 RepID=UPI002B6BB896|nr:mechanosensitive ion channel domain-containing protein [Hansschlegelia sp.]HVI29756.1 mechanosensitive ion channel domain-containing protein [Hansschlegelia sp.]